MVVVWLVISMAGWEGLLGSAAGLGATTPILKLPVVRPLAGGPHRY